VITPEPAQPRRDGARYEQTADGRIHQRRSAQQGRAWTCASPSSCMTEISYSITRWTGYPVSAHSESCISRRRFATGREGFDMSIGPSRRCRLVRESPKTMSSRPCRGGRPRRPLGLPRPSRLGHASRRTITSTTTPPATIAMAITSKAVMR